jgi:putative redox protein
MKTVIKWVDGAMFVGETDSGHAVVMDGPPDGGGRNLGARPMEMLLLGMGACTGYDVVSILRKARQSLEHCEVTVEAQRADTVPKVFTRIHVNYRFVGRGLDRGAVERAIALSTEKYCSATIMLGKVVDITHDYTIDNGAVA